MNESGALLERFGNNISIPNQAEGENIFDKMENNFLGEAGCFFLHFFKKIHFP